jgi:hypothetical protein
VQEEHGRRAVPAAGVLAAARQHEVRRQRLLAVDRNLHVEHGRHRGGGRRGPRMARGGRRDQRGGERERGGGERQSKASDGSQHRISPIGTPNRRQLHKLISN